VIAWLIGYVQLKRGYSSSEYAWGSFWFVMLLQIIICHLLILSHIAFRTYTALLIVLIIANVVGLVTAIKLINRMKNFTLQGIFFSFVCVRVLHLLIFFFFLFFRTLDFSAFASR
jgi:hypothetical protein